MDLQQLQVTITPITAASIRASIPITIAFRDFVSRECEILIELRSDDYHKSQELLFFSEERGGKLTVQIKGKPGFCLATLHNLVARAEHPDDTQTHLELMKARIDEMKHWQLKTPLGDLFCKREELTIEMQGSTFRKSSIFLLAYSESGAKYSVSVKGKPGFSQLVASQLKLFAPKLTQMLNNLLSAPAT